MVFTECSAPATRAGLLCKLLPSCHPFGLVEPLPSSLSAATAAAKGGRIDGRA